MIQNLGDSASEIIHYRARTVIVENTLEPKAYTAFNPRLGKEAKLTVFEGITAQEIDINPSTGGYELSNARAIMSAERKTSIDLTGNSTEQKGSASKSDNATVQQNSSSSRRGISQVVLRNEPNVTKIREHKKGKTKTKKSNGSCLWAYHSWRSIFSYEKICS